MKKHDEFSDYQLKQLGYRHKYNIGKNQLWWDGEYYLLISSETRKVERYYTMIDGKEIDL